MADQPPQQQQQKQESYLSAEERAELRRMLHDPSDYPHELGSWITEFIGVNGIEVPIDSIRGYSQFQAKHAAVAASGAITQSDYGDLTTGAGPTISDVADGKFICLFGAFLPQGTPIDRQGAMAPAVNGESLGTDDTNAAIAWNASNGMRVVTLDLQNGGNNVVRMKYRSVTGGTPTVHFQNRWMVLLRYGN